MITIPLHSSHNLIWSPTLPTTPFLIHLDFQLTPLHLSNLIHRQTLLFNLNHFLTTLFPSLAPQTLGFILYQGPILDTPSLSTLLLHLAAPLPDDLPAYALFDPSPSLTSGQRAYLLSQERFLHIQLSLTPSTSPSAVLLPTDPYCTPSLLASLTHLLDQDPTLRVIPETKLSENWHGLDDLIVFTETLTLQGKRQLSGFEAAGGKVRSRGIRTPDPLLPKQLR